MEINDSTHIGVPEEALELGVASTATKGGPLAGEEIGGPNVLGISEE
jgi:hypothetical protein